MPVPEKQQAAPSVHYRNVKKLTQGYETSDGAGVKLKRYIASPELEMLDPFLLLDVFHSDNPNDYIAGFPPHPHRGFETVTYLLHGRMRHKDSAGHEGVIQAGGVQWMTAGRGIEHSEMPEQDKGVLYGFQLWVNLPANKKMQPPRYQEFEPGEVALEKRDNGTELRVIAGNTVLGTKGPVTNIAAAPLYIDISLAAGTQFNEQIPTGHNAFIYVISGEINILSNEKTKSVGSEMLAVLSDGNELLLEAKKDSRLLLVAGKPFKEPVARYGPFVMNTQAEINQAYTDYQDGQFGMIQD